MTIKTLKKRMDPSILDAVMSKAKVDEPAQAPVPSSPDVEVVKAAPVEARKSARKTPLTLTMSQDLIDSLDSLRDGRSRASIIEAACREWVAKQRGA
jgi:hypothetical protein